MDFGWFAFLAKPLFLMVNWVNDGFVHNYGWAIVVVTVVTQLRAVPAEDLQHEVDEEDAGAAAADQGHQRQVQGHRHARPAQAEQNQEVMDLYKKHGVNPMGGCVPMLLQIPFFIAFYKVFTVAVEMRGASWLWVTRPLAARDTWPSRSCRSP